MPCLRQTSAVDAPASCSRRTPMICSSVNRERFIVRPLSPRADSTQFWRSFRGSRQGSMEGFIMRFAVSIVAAAALALATLPAKADPIAASSVDYNFIHGSYTITDNGPDVIFANPGDTITVSGGLTVNDTNDGFCPGCIIQFYVSGLPAGPD